jgi:hypothetical protein
MNTPQSILQVRSLTKVIVFVLACALGFQVQLAHAWCSFEFQNVTDMNANPGETSTQTFQLICHSSQSYNIVSIALVSYPGGIFTTVAGFGNSVQLWNNTPYELRVAFHPISSGDFSCEVDVTAANGECTTSQWIYGHSPNSSFDMTSNPLELYCDSPVGQARTCWVTFIYTGSVTRIFDYQLINNAGGVFYCSDEWCGYGTGFQQGYPQSTHVIRVECMAPTVGNYTGTIRASTAGFNYDVTLHCNATTPQCNLLPSPGFINAGQLQPNAPTQTFTVNVTNNGTASSQAGTVSCSSPAIHFVSSTDLPALAPGAQWPFQFYVQYGTVGVQTVPINMNRCNNPSVSVSFEILPPDYIQISDGIRMWASSMQQGAPGIWDFSGATTRIMNNQNQVIAELDNAHSTGNTNTHTVNFLSYGNAQRLLMFDALRGVGTFNSLVVNGSQNVLDFSGIVSVDDNFEVGGQGIQFNVPQRWLNAGSLSFSPMQHLIVPNASFSLTANQLNLAASRTTGLPALEMTQGLEVQPKTPL